MSVVTSKTETVSVGPRSNRTQRTVTSTTYHADPNCPQIALADHAEGGGPEDAAWDCDYCCPGGVERFDDAPVPGEDIPLPTPRNQARIDGGRSGARRNQFGDARRPSEAQERYIRSLLRQLGSDADAWIADATERGVWTKREASRLIDGLKAELASAGPDPAVADERRTNRYAGKCVKCGFQVDAEAGFLAKTSDGRWAAEHRTGQCPEHVAPEPEAEPVPVGIHRFDDQVYKVQLAIHGSGNPYAKLLVVRELEDGTKKGEFVYAQGAIRNLSSATLLSLDEARQYGEIYGVCCNCGISLTDEGSIANGIGPVCGQRILEWSTGVVLTKAQMTMYLQLVDGEEVRPAGMRLVTARALVDAGLAEWGTGTELLKAVA